MGERYAMGEQNGDEIKNSLIVYTNKGIYYNNMERS